MTRAEVPPEELAYLPCVGDFDLDSAESEVMRKLPHTLIICARKAEARSR